MMKLDSAEHSILNFNGQTCYLGNLTKMQILINLGRGLSTCTSQECPGDFDAAHPETTLGLVGVDVLMFKLQVRLMQNPACPSGK